MIVWMYKIGFEALGPDLCQPDDHTGSQSTLKCTLSFVLPGGWRQLECDLTSELSWQCPFLICQKKVQKDMLLGVSWTRPGHVHGHVHRGHAF